MSGVGLGTAIGRLALRNPVLVASGTYGSGLEAMEAGVDLSRIGGVVTKSVTTRKRRGNPPPRIHETAAGMLNSIGIMNPGIEGFRARVLPAFKDLPCVRIVNVAGETSDDFESLVRVLGDEEAVDGIELNVSCPNVSGGLDFGVDPALLEPLVLRCRQATGKPLIVKLTPNVADVLPLALAAERGGADALSLVNTYRGMAVDWRARRPELGSPTGEGGLSGPAIKPLALSALRRARSGVRLPLVGIGGIACADDVLEFIVTGACAVQVGTANFRDPGMPVRIAGELEALAVRGEIEDIASMIGTLRYGSPPRP